MRRPKLAPLVLIASAAISACQDSPLAPGTDAPELRIGVPEKKLSVCHGALAHGRVLEIAPAALAAHLRHGDYVARLLVTKDVGDRGDGVHFARIGDALAAARATRAAHGESSAAACRITIAVGPGLFVGSVQESADPTVERFPLLLDVPDVTLEGSFRMQLDADGRATGASAGPATTILAASPGLRTTNLVGVAQSFLSEPMILVTDAPDGTGGTGAVVEGFELRAGNDAPGARPGGNAVYAMRARDLVIRGNRLDGGFAEAMPLRSSTARVVQNHVSGPRERCTLCLSGPGDFEVTGNRLLGSGLDGIFIVPAAILRVPPLVRQQVLQPTAAVTAIIHNNEIRDFQERPVGVALRVGALGANASDVIGSARVEATDNDLVGNTFGVMVEASFPTADTRRQGDVSLGLRGNTIAGSCQNDLLVSFTRHTTGLGIGSGAIFQTSAYLRNSTFTLDLGGDVAWSDAWYVHPAGLGNTLVVDGQLAPNGTRVAYDAARECPVAP